MSERLKSRRAIYILWAMVLAAGISFSSAQAATLHAACTETCQNACGSSSCSRSRKIGCTCYYQCDDGTVGTVACTI
jgi:hypothetical protein